MICNDCWPAARRPRRHISSGIGPEAAASIGHGNL